MLLLQADENKIQIFNLGSQQKIQILQATPLEFTGWFS